MARRRYKSEISGITSIIPLRTSTRTPIRHQLYEGLRGAIQSGQLTGGVQLRPPARWHTSWKSPARQC